MNVVVTKKALDGALTSLTSVVPSRSSNPLLTAAHVTVTASGLTLRGTNLEIDLELHVPAETRGSGAFAVSAALFGQLVKNCPGSTVELSVQGNEVRIVSGGFDTRIQLADTDAYPPLVFPERVDATVQAEEWVRAQTHVRYAAATDAFQAVFRGLRVALGSGKLHMVGSDGYRLSTYGTPVAYDGPERVRIVPGRSADEIVRLFRAGGDLNVTFGEGVITLAGASGRMNVKLLDGEFPDYERVMPKAVIMSFTLAASTLKEAINRVAVLADKSANNRVEMLVSEGKLRLAAEGDYGRAQDVMDVTQAGDEERVSLAFNARHLLDALSPVVGDVTFEPSGLLTPVRLTAQGDAGYVAVLLPLRV